MADDDFYDGVSGREDWKMAVGPIVLQEHDNQVQFHSIQINRCWQPGIYMRGDWQHDH